MRTEASDRNRYKRNTKRSEVVASGVSSSSIRRVFAFELFHFETRLGGRLRRRDLVWYVLSCRNLHKFIASISSETVDTDPRKFGIVTVMSF